MRNEDDLRAVLQSLERHAPTLETVLSRAPRRPERPRRTFRWRTWLGTGGPLLVAVAVVVAVVAPLTVGKILHSAISAPNGPAGSVPDHPTAAQVLNAAALVAAAQPAQPPGKYWRVSIASTMLIPGGTNAHPYALRETLSPWVTWYPMRPTKNQWYIAYSDAGYTTTLATPGGAAQWRAAGSPALPSAKLRVVGMEA